MKVRVGAGAHPNFMKIAPVVTELGKRGHETMLEGIISWFEQVLAQPRRATSEDCPEGWVGRAAEPLVGALEAYRNAPAAAGL